jgi:uncharacterized protein (TIGR02147 family)
VQRTLEKKMKAEESSNKPNIFEYDDFKIYLKDIYNYLKKTEKKFSYRSFAKKAGLSSHSFYEKVIEGRSKMSADSIAKFSKGLDHSSAEHEFFGILVNFNQAESLDSKKRYLTMMQNNKRYRTIRELEVDQYEYFSKWYYPAVRELVLHSGFKEDPEWIAKTLMPKITEKEAEGALALLFSLKLIQRGENNKIIPHKGILASAKQVHSTSILNFHQNMLDRASKAVEDFPTPLRDNSCIVFSVDEENIDIIKKKILRFRRSLISTCATKKSDYDRVYQMSIALFPLTKKLD